MRTLDRLPGEAPRLDHRLSTGLRRVATGAATLAAFSAGVRVARADVAVVSPVYPDAAQQRIDGFGASSAWTATSMSPSDAETVFSKDTGVGLSLLRVRIQPCDLSTSSTCVLTTTELPTAQLAQMNGARVWAAPWSPPAAWKIGAQADAGLNGGTLDPAHYQDWAQALVAFVQSMQGSGIDLLGLSAQNEPDLLPSPYESCSYDPATLASFITQALGPALQRANLIAPKGSFQLIGPETIGFPGFALYMPTLDAPASGPNAASFLGVLATHQYGPIASPLGQAVTNLQKPVWQTEVYPQDVGADVTMTTGLWVAQHIHEALVISNVSAWHYWWIYSLWNDPSDADSQGLWDGPSQSWSKRLYVMGNYSKFVRPGFYRMSTISPASSGVEVTAFRDPYSQTLVIVAINPGMTDVDQTFVMDAATTGTFSAWVTSNTEDLVDESDAVAGGHQFDYTLKAQSVTTLVGTLTGPGPAYVPPEAPIGDATAPPPTAMARPSSPAPAAGQGASGGSGLACSVDRGLAGGHAKTGAGVLAGLVFFLAMARPRRRS